MNTLSNNFPRFVKGLRVPKAAAVGMILGALALIVAACGGGGEAQTIRPTWIEPQVSGTTVSIPASEVEKNTIVHFRIPAATGGSLTFMAYKLDGNLQVRADVCPPCRSTSFSLSGDILVCDTCSTKFKATTGEGVSGACVNYPKAAIAYETNNGNIVMNADALVTAYQNTIAAGLP
ncbi:MAG: Fe-S-containing protein [Dehalococcoidales bacterium]|nr:Fe-S-containing protein [Dehalococcoidales bacterium]